MKKKNHKSRLEKKIISNLESFMINGGVQNIDPFYLISLFKSHDPIALDVVLDDGS
jgi:hypothetical protein